MGVSLGYFSTKPVPLANHRQLLALVAAANEEYDWWCESIWFSDTPDEAGKAFGFTKLFCMIDDEDTDTWMASLDVCRIIRFLTSVAERLGIEWRLEIEGAPFGIVTRAGPDAESQGNSSGFLDMFPGAFESLRSRPREEILAEWSDR
ncbi:MAG: hypothetical protein WD066_10015 [Planctomycetaceae bacterium]